MKVEFAPHPPQFACRIARSTGGRQAGILFERKVQLVLSPQDGYLPSPWLHIWTDEGKENWAQPDGLHFDLSAWEIRILEVKIKHCAEARTQLQRYRGLIQQMFPGWPVHLVEIVRWLDPDVKGFGPFSLCPDPFTYKGRVPGVHILRV